VRGQPIPRRRVTSPRRPWEPGLRHCRRHRSRRSPVSDSTLAEARSRTPTSPPTRLTRPEADFNKSIVFLQF